MNNRLSKAVIRGKDVFQEVRGFREGTGEENKQELRSRSRRGQVGYGIGFPAFFQSSR